MTHPATASGHPTRCWTLDGHERCALLAAAAQADNRAAHLSGRARLFRELLVALDRGEIRVEEIPPGALDAALQVLGVELPSTITWHPGSRR